MGAQGFKIITSNVKDLLQDGQESPGVELTSFCSLSNLQDFKLDPPRVQATKTQAALVVISSVLRVEDGQPVSFMVDSVQLVRPEEVETVKAALKRLLFLTTLAGHMASRKRTASAALTHEDSLAKGWKCPA